MLVTCNICGYEDEEENMVALPDGTFICPECENGKTPQASKEYLELIERKDEPAFPDDEDTTDEVG